MHNYFIEEGGAEWNGSLYVFDGRVAVPAESPEEAERRWHGKEGEESREGEGTRIEGVVKGLVNSCFHEGQSSPFR